MIKGVNKNVIEISDTGNECFERAILFVRADSGDSDQLRRRANEFVNGLKLRPWFYPRGRLWFSALKLAAAAAAGAGAMAVFLR